VFASGTVECGETSVLNASAPTSFGNPWRVQDEGPNNEDEDFTDDISVSNVFMFTGILVASDAFVVRTAYLWQNRLI
jgi:hypothetical protein